MARLFSVLLQTATSHGALQIEYLKSPSQNLELGQQQPLGYHEHDHNKQCGRDGL